MNAGRVDTAWDPRCAVDGVVQGVFVVFIISSWWWCRLKIKVVMRRIH